MKRNYKKTAFVGGQLIDGTGAAPVKDALVLVDDGKIVYAGANTGNIDGYELKDISGKTILPGLIDVHLHFSGNLTGNDSEWVTEPNDQKVVVAVQQAHDCLETGITTVGEVSRSGIHIRNMIEAGEMKGPRMVCSGLGLCATASHGDSHHCSIEQNRNAHPWAECVDSPWDLRKAVRRRLRENPDAIKIWATGGGIWRWETARDQHYTYEEVKAVVDECKMRNIPVWSHCFGDAYNSIKAGVNLLIHGFEINEETADLMVEQGTIFCPTINFMPDWLKTFPPVYVPEIHDKYQGETVAEKEMNRIYDNLRKTYEKGVMLTIGSDCFNNEITPYGYTTVGELHMFVEKVGISPMETIKAATLNGAKALRVDDITGSIKVGKSADLIVVNGDPLENIRAIDVDNMEIIMKEGEYVRV